MIGLRDMRVKYKQAALGPLWLFLAPFGMAVALVIAFYGVTNPQTSGIPYAPFMLVGLTVWTFFQLGLSVGAGSIVGNSALVKRSPAPRISLVVGPLLGNFPPFLVMLSFALGASAIAGLASVKWALLPLLILWLFIFTLGTVLCVASLAVKYRDLVSVLPLIVQAGIFVSPVGYGLAGAPSTLQAILILNPITGLIEAWRWALVGLPEPSLAAIGIAGAWTVILAVIGWLIFSRMEVSFADYV